MKLLYKISYNSTSGYFRNIIDDLIVEFGVNATCTQYKTFLVIACDDSEDKIQSFFKLLENSLPLSIFLDKAEVIDFVDPALQPLEEHNLSQKIAILPSKIIEVYNQSTAYAKEAKAIANNEIVSFETSNGAMKIALPTKANREALGKNAHLMIINLNAINDLLALNQKDVQLLSSIERPLVKLKFNILRNSNQEFSSTNFVYAKLPCDEAEYTMATALRKEDINFVLYTVEAKQEELKATYSDEQTIIISGDKAIFPKYDYTLNEIYNSSQEYFEKSGGVFKATLSQYNKRLENAVGVYMSMKSSQSNISINIPSKGVTAIIKVPNVLTDFNNCIEDIEGIDENTPRLVANYKKKFPEVFSSTPKLEGTDGFETILNLTAHLLGLEDAEAFEAKALEFNAKSGINVDFVIAKIDGTNYLDYRRIVQSIMSYKMAGVENHMLAFSFYESLSEFIADNISKIKSEMDLNNVVLCGDMFANSTLLSKTLKALTAYNVMIPKEYPLDIY